MSDDLTDGAAGLAVLIVLAGGMWFGSCMGADDAVEEFDATSCKLACERHRAGKVHSVDQTYCVCEFGRTFKRDRSRLYVPVSGGKGGSP